MIRRPDWEKKRLDELFPPRKTFVGRVLDILRPYNPKTRTHKNSHWTRTQIGPLRFSAFTLYVKNVNEYLAQIEGHLATIADFQRSFLEGVPYKFHEFLMDGNLFTWELREGVSVGNVFECNGIDYKVIQVVRRLPFQGHEEGTPLVITERLPPPAGGRRPV